MKKFLAILATFTAAFAAQAQIYTGAGIGYLIDAEEEYFTARLGFQVAERGSLAHGLEVEVGFLTESEGGAKLDLVPVMANYRGSVTINDKLGIYFGGGAGASFFRVSTRWGSVRDEAFSVQGFGGVEFRPTPNVSLLGGLRYLWIDDVWGVEVGDDVAIEVGIKFRF
jgi:opacity protein-like surface antigen